MLQHRGWRVWLAAAAVAVALFAASAAYAAVTGMSRVSIKGPSGQLSGTSAAPSVSADGRYVVFESDAPDVASGAYAAGGPSIYLRDRTSQETTLVSRPAPGTGKTDHPSHKPRISADGRYVVFASEATNLTGSWDGVTNAGIYRWDRLTGSIERVDVAPEGSAFAWGSGLVRTDNWWWTSVSSDGRYVAYAAPVAAGSPLVEVFRRDMVTGAIVTVSTGRGSGIADSSPAMHPAMSADGSRVAFSSVANIADLALYSGRHVYLRDLNAGTTALVSVPGIPVAAADASDWPSMDASGNVVAFVSSASNLVASSLDAVPNVLVRDMRTGVTTLASKGSVGAATGACTAPSVSRDGRYVAFQSVADNLKLSGTTYPYYALFVLDRSTGSLAATGKQALQIPSDAGSTTQFTGDARFVAFSSESTALVSADTNGARDVFLFEYKYRPTPTLTTPTLSTSYVRRYRTFTVYGKVSKHSGARGKVEIRVYRRLSSGTKLYKTYTVYTGVSSTSFKKSLSLPYTGKWCVRTYHPECGVYASKYSSYRYFTVYR